MPPIRRDPDVLRAVAGGMQHEIQQLRWLRYSGKELKNAGQPELTALLLDVAKYLALTPLITLLMGRLAKALAGTARPGAVRRRRQ